MQLSPKRDVNFNILDDEKFRRIHEASLTILEDVGLKIEGKKVLELLYDSGATKTQNGLTRIPASLVEKALERVPKEFTLYSRDGKPYARVKKDSIYFGTHADQLEIIDPDTGKARKFLRKDTELMARIADYLPNIDFVLSVGLHADVPTSIQSQIAFIETLKHFSKPINFSTNDVQGLKDIIEIAAMVAGGRKELREKPFLFCYCEPIPPLTHPEPSTEKLRISAEAGIPVIYMPYCMMGGTAPMSFAGALVQCNADVLAGLVISQLVNEGTPYIYGAMPSIFDMRTTIGSYGAPEFALLVAASSEIAYRYGLPFYGTAGTTDAKFIDEQAVAEVTMFCFAALLSKANLVHDVGVMDHCNNVSPEMVVLADEIIEMLKHFVQGVRVTDEDLALDVIKEVGPGGHFLTTEHTARNFKTVWYPQLFSRKMKNEEFSEVRDKIQGKIRYIMENHQVPPLDPLLLKELDRWDALLKQEK
ncbi:MAG: trimethylamine methyltransferase family protein [Thermacetogeniaceae bacterium]